MEFLRKLVYDRQNYTNVFIQFEAVGKLPEEEEVEEEEDEGQAEEEIENFVLPSNIHSSPSSQSVRSESSQSSSSSAIEKKFTCGNCNVRQKNVAMECGHSVCAECYENIKEQRKIECVNVRGVKRREKEEKKNKVSVYKLWPYH